MKSRRLIKLERRFQELYALRICRPAERRPALRSYVSNLAGLAAAPTLGNPEMSAAYSKAFGFAAVLELN